MPPLIILNFLFQPSSFSTFQILVCLLQIQRSLICLAEAFCQCFNFIFRYMGFENDLNFFAQLFPPLLLGINVIHRQAAVSQTLTEFLTFSRIALQEFLTIVIVGVAKSSLLMISENSIVSVNIKHLTAPDKDYYIKVS